ncbi:MAG: hypothetical protein V8R46_00905 [Eubacterium ramulus]
MLIFLLAALFVAVSTLILQKNYKTNALEDGSGKTWISNVRMQSIRWYQTGSIRRITDEINTKADMDTPRYQELQAEQNELRT